MFDLPDPATLRLSSFLASMAFAAVFAALARGRRDPWMRWWAAASGSYCVVLFLVDRTGDPLAPLAAAGIDAMLALSTAMILCGVRVFDGRPPFARWMWAVIAVSLLLPAVSRLLPAAAVVPAAQLLSSAVLMGCMIAFGAPLLFDRAEDGTRMARRVVGAGLIAYVPSYVAASLSILLVPQSVDFLVTLPLVFDQLLLGVINLALLAMPGLRSQLLLRDAALRDPLTGAWNRAALAASEAALLVPGRVVLLVDVDHFKAINDSHGHATGDRVLQAIAAGLQRAVAGDFVCRLGGDEFLVVTSAEDAASIAERVRARAGIAVAGLPPWSVSVGFARIVPDDIALADGMQRADRAMYRAKAEGRGRIAA